MEPTVTAVARSSTAGWGTFPHQYPATQRWCGQVVIPAGGLTLNNGAVTMVTNGGQINSANTVTLNGPSTLTLVGANSLAGLVFNVDGGVQTGPTVATGAGALTLTGGITADGSNPNATAVISGAGGLNLNGATNYAMAVSGSCSTRSLSRRSTPH